ncbi:MAG TPA: fumarylacetoacetate hydrolase family protein [Pseudonocardiaceae bacterium]
MRLASIRTPDGPRLGVGVRVDGTELVVRADATGVPVPATPLEFLALPEPERARVLTAATALAADGPSGDTVFALDDAPLGPPVATPSKIICLALNYKAHADEGGFTAPDRPVLFLKGPHTLAGHRDDVVVPPISRRIDHEGELAVVVGRRCRHLTEDDWHTAVAGYSVLNDLTARDLQLVDIERSHPWDLSKNLDGYGPMGPWLVTPDEVPDPQALDLRVTVDGEVRQSGSTAQMIFGVAELLIRLSAVMTLEAGDIIATGTCDGIGPVPDGSVVEVSVGDLGVLRNRVRFAPAGTEGRA